MIQNLELNPAETATKLNEAYFNANDAAGRMKGAQKTDFVGQTMADDYKLTPFNQLAP
ncbi:hypothetical protein [Chryseobacterium wanjuense]